MTTMISFFIKREILNKDKVFYRNCHSPFHLSKVFSHRKKNKSNFYIKSTTKHKKCAIYPPSLLPSSSSSQSSLVPLVLFLLPSQTLACSLPTGILVFMLVPPPSPLHLLLSPHTSNATPAGAAPKWESTDPESVPPSTRKVAP